MKITLKKQKSQRCGAKPYLEDPPVLWVWSSATLLWRCCGNTPSQIQPCALSTDTWTAAATYNEPDNILHKI